MTKYYSSNAINRKNATYNVIFGERSNGKTYALLKQALQDYIKDGDRSVFFSTHLMEDLEKIADYIFFIHNGQQVFFDTKDALIMDYVLVKGGFEDAGHESLKKAVHIQKSKVSFEALIKKSDLDQTKHSFLVEKVSVDDVVTHYMKKLNEDPMYC